MAFPTISNAENGDKEKILPAAVVIRCKSNRYLRFLLLCCGCYSSEQLTPFAFLQRWKKKYNVKILLAISFILLFFGATETCYGVLPITA